MTTAVPVIAIVGATATGKTRRAVQLALRYDAEIISADSRQIYRGMDLGTGKDLQEYIVATETGDRHAPVHLIDIRPAGYKYNLHEFLRDFHQVYADITTRGKQTILCGGSGLYVESVLSGLRLPDVPCNPELRESLRTKTLEELTAILAGMRRLHNTTDTDTPTRAIRAIEIEQYYSLHPEYRTDIDRQLTTPLDSVIIGLEISREDRRCRITERLYQRLQQGMIEEVKQLLHSGICAEDLIYYGLEYKYITLYLQHKLTLQEMISQLEIAIHQFAKRQMTWLRGMERRGFTIHWIPYDVTDEEFAVRVDGLMADMHVAPADSSR